MRVTIRFLKPLKDAIGRDSLDVEVEGGTVLSVLEQISARHPELRRELLSENGSLDYRINVILNDKPLTSLNVELKDGDSVTLFIPISGG